MEKVPNDLAAPRKPSGSCSGPLVGLVCMFADFVAGGLKKNNFFDNLYDLRSEFDARVFWEVAMTDERYKTWDVGLKLAGLLGLILTAAIGLLEWIGNAKQSTAQLYFDKQLQYYLDVTNTVAAIATSQDTQKRDDLTQKFETLFYGPMAILEDRASPDFTKYQPGEKYTQTANVERYMIAVHDCLLRNCGNRELQEVSLALADACRFALSTSWASGVANLKTALSTQRLGLPPDKDK
jgi:hypothetical protein